MDYQSFFSIFFLFILTINYSLTLSHFDISNDNLDPSVEQVSTDDQVKWRRQQDLAPSRANINNKNKSKSRVLKYDFLLHQWMLRNMGK